MAIKPQNVVPVLKDKKVQILWDLSAGLAIAGGAGVIFADADHAYQVIAVDAIVTVVTTAVATTLIVGTVADTNRYVEATAISAGIVAAGTTIAFTLAAAPLLLPAGTPLVAVSTGTGNTGECQLVVTLRPVELPRGNATKRPQNAASPT